MNDRLITYVYCTTNVKYPFLYISSLYLNLSPVMKRVGVSVNGNINMDHMVNDIYGVNCIIIW